MARVVLAVLAALATASLPGCLGAAAYEQRIKDYETYLGDLQKLNQYTNPPAGGKLQQLGVTVRTPIPLQEGTPPIQAPTFDAVAYFSGAQANVPMQVYILARKKGQAAAKPKAGETPPAQRGAFSSDVRTILDSLYGGNAAEGQVVQMNEGGKPFSRKQFNAANGNTVKVDQYDQGNYEVALIWEFAPAAATSEAVEPGIRLTLSSLSVGGGGIQSAGGAGGF
jgi:hypothetical protein